VKFAELYSTYLTFPDGNLGISIEMNGTYSLPKYEFYAYMEGTPNVIFLTGSAQPNVFGQYEVATSVLDFVEGLGCKTLIALGGYGARSQREVGAVYAVVNDPMTAEELRKYDIQIARGGAVTGACGLILGLGSQRKMRCIGLLGSTRGVYPDLEAARALILLISQMYNLPIDLSDLDAEIADLKSKITRLREIQAEVLEETREEKKRERRGRYIT
jgi:proteasome assembly chaperone (PAC2) family protein